MRQKTTENATEAPPGSKPWAKAVATTFIAAQILIPAALLSARWVNEGSIPASEYRYSWQMYSAAKTGHYTGTTHEGETKNLSLENLPVISRAIAYTDDVPKQLCNQHPELSMVTRIEVEDALADHERTYQC